MLDWLESDHTVTFTIHVQPGASRCAIRGVHNQALKISVNQPPVDGAANQACIRMLAKALKVKQSSLSITHGFTGRTKTVRIDNFDGPTLEQRLAHYLEEGT